MEWEVAHLIEDIRERTVSEPWAPRLELYPAPKTIGTVQHLDNSEIQLLEDWIRNGALGNIKR